MKPIVAIAGLLREHNEASAWKYRECFVNEAYTSQLAKAQAIPYILPYIEPEYFEELLAPCSALLVPGGMDFDPSYYGEEKNALTLPPDPQMDFTQLELIKTAKKMGKWVFGICRGFQGINISCGGTLFQDITEQRPESLIHMRKDTPYEPVHKVYLNEGTHLYEMYGKKEALVNSLHHQGVKTLGKNLTAAAVSEDGIIEGFEGDHILAVQWHPEALTTPFFDYIVKLLK